MTVLMVEQNAYETMDISDRCYVLQAGAIVMSGNSSDIMKDPQVREAGVAVSLMILQ